VVASLNPRPFRRTRIKFCGLTRLEDIAAAVALGVDAIGLILVPGSPRALSVEQAAALRRAVPPLVSAVVLLRNADVGMVQAAIDAVEPDLLQFHGEETPAFCAQFGRPYLKSVAMAGEQRSLAEIAAEYASAAALLLDGHAPGTLGGQGRSFDWTRAEGRLVKPLMLAGGLSPANVESAIGTARPFAVDVSSGVESSPGCKDSGKMRDFVDAVRRADQSLR
jgi:phosphoribosylanthranilate isomerase